VIIAEKGALIGFAGKRVIQQTIKQDLPHGFQTAEFQQNKGFVDIVCNRNELRNILYKLLILHGVKS
jgi:acetyl-CoA carboxylase carboxyl transferase subunit beta